MFKIEIYADHEEQCGSRTYKCDDCQRFICLKDKERHLTSGQCQEFQNENKQKEILEQQKAMEELRQFQEKEAKRRALSKEKREAREKQEAKVRKQMEQLNRQKIPSNVASSAKGGPPNRSQNIEQPREMVTKPSSMQRGMIQNNKPAARTGQVVNNRMSGSASQNKREELKYPSSQNR